MYSINLRNRAYEIQKFNCVIHRILIVNFLRAQQHEVVFGYDGAGNRVSRYTNTLPFKSQIMENNSQDLSHKDIKSKSIQYLLFNENLFTAYPNPTDGLVNVQFNEVIFMFLIS